MIDMIGLTFLDEGDEVLFSAPTYGAFADMAYLNGGVPVSYRLPKSRNLISLP